MTMRLHILSDRPTNQNTQAFLLPILVNQAALRDRGVEVRCYFDIGPELCECDVLAINNKVWSGNFQDHRSERIDRLGEFAERIDKVLYFDRSSTPGHIIPDIFPYVTKYLKTSLFHDRSMYLRKLYGGRAFADYYHDRQGIEDEVEHGYSPLTSEAQLAKLGVSWNTGLGNYSLAGPRWMRLYATWPLRAFLLAPRFYHSPLAARPIDVSCRMETNYTHNTVKYQRQEMARILEDYRRTERISKLAYVRELKRSKIVASPFGYSEINYKDFETFMYGACLLKPDMSHLDTYPDLYRKDETYLAHSWLLDDVRDKIEQAMSDPSWRHAVACAGQEKYRWHVSTRGGREQFVERLVAFLDGGTNPHQTAAH